MTPDTKKPDTKKPDTQKPNTRKPDTRKTDYHSRPATEVLKTFDVDPNSGLNDQQVRQRMEKYGPNKLKEARVRGSWEIFIDQFKSMVLIVLAAAATIAFLFHHWAEGLAIIAVLFVNTAIGFVTEKKLSVPCRHCGQ